MSLLDTLLFLISRLSIEPVATPYDTPPKEANSAMDRLKGLSDQNQPAAIEALLCARRTAEASQIAVKALAGGVSGTHDPGDVHRGLGQPRQAGERLVRRQRRRSREGALP